MGQSPWGNLSMTIWQELNHLNTYYLGGAQKMKNQWNLRICMFFNVLRDGKYTHRNYIVRLNWLWIMAPGHDPALHTCLLPSKRLPSLCFQFFNNHFISSVVLSILSFFIVSFLFQLVQMTLICVFFNIQPSQPYW